MNALLMAVVRRSGFAAVIYRMTGEVLKTFEPDRGHTILTSYNDTARPIIVDEANPGVVQGIYLGLQLKGPRLR